MSQEFDSEVLNLFKQKRFCSYETLTCKNEFYISIRGRRITDKKCQYVLKVWNNFEIKLIKGYHDL